MAAELLKQFSIYVNTSPGSENVLRLLQFTCFFVQSLSVQSAAKWAKAGKQFALGRRYFRYFKFIECFRTSWEKFSGNDVQLVKRGSVALTIETCRWSALGCYILLEAFTILDALGVETTSWGGACFLESNRFWFYALALEILGLLWRLVWLRSEYHVSEGSTKPGSRDLDEKENKENEDENSAKPNGVTRAQVLEEYSNCRRNLTKGLFVTSCDIMVPGSVVGWIRISASTMSAAAILSTLIVGRDRWIKAQAAARG